MTKPKEVEKIKNQIIQGYNPEKIILFGSQANGKSKPNSDIDLAVIKRTNSTFSQRLKQIAQVIKSWEALDILIYTPKEWKDAINDNNYFIKEISQTGKVIYEK